MVICPFRLLGNCKNPGDYFMCGHGLLHNPLTCAVGLQCNQVMKLCPYTSVGVQCREVADHVIDLAQTYLNEVHRANVSRPMGVMPKDEESTQA